MFHRGVLEAAGDPRVPAFGDLGPRRLKHAKQHARRRRAGDDPVEAVDAARARAVDARGTPVHRAGARGGHALRDRNRTRRLRGVREQNRAFSRRLANQTRKCRELAVPRKRDALRRPDRAVPSRVQQRVASPANSSAAHLGRARDRVEVVQFRGTRRRFNGPVRAVPSLGQGPVAAHAGVQAADRRARPFAGARNRGEFLVEGPRSRYRLQVPGRV